MNKKDCNQRLDRCCDTLVEITELLQKAQKIDLKDLMPEKTALVIVDMVNGFAREGALMSPDVEKLIPGITELLRECKDKKIQALAFADCHTEASPEFEAYPIHCLKGTSESEIVDEIRRTGGYMLIPKNSTNGFLEEEFQGWLKDNTEIKNFIVTGDCTDICIQQFAISLKTWFNKQNSKSRIIVPMNTVDTYDLGTHNRDLMNLMAFYNMMINGVEIVSEIITQGINYLLKP